MLPYNNINNYSLALAFVYVDHSEMTLYHQDGSLIF